MTIADWIMVEDGDCVFGTKELKNGQKVIRVNELYEIAMDAKEDMHPSNEYLFTDVFVVDQGVFKWNKNTESFKKISDSYDCLSKPIPKFPQQIIDLAEKVVGKKDVIINDWDLDRVYLNKGKDEMTIRMWDITDTYIRWTLFLDVPDNDGGSHGEEIKSGIFKLKESMYK